MQNWKQIHDTYLQKSQSSFSTISHDLDGMSPSLQNNLDTLNKVLGDNGDLVIRDFVLFGVHHAALVFFSTLVNLETIQDHILKPLMAKPANLSDLPENIDEINSYIWSNVVHVTKGKVSSDLASLPEDIVKGQLILFIDGGNQALTFDMRKIEQRGVEQPQTEQVIRGSREGFVEKLENNLSLLRYRLQTPDFRIEISPLGTRTKSKVAMCYIEGITNKELVAEVMRRISLIDTDSIIDSGYIEQFIEDQPLSPFPQVQNTERPDKTVAALLEGRVAILVDGSPFSLIVPALFNQFLQALDDYTERFMIGSLLRIIRLLALLFSLIFPALYVSIISFNPELMPTEFAVAISGSRAGVPFPAVLEVLIMEVSMEILREATIRLPQKIGGALSIVGVLVIGQAAVAAGLASPITVVVIALTTIGSFASPSYNEAISLRMLRFPIIFMAGMFGLLGVMIGMIIICNHLLYLESFGVPYMSPYVPGKWRDMKDTLVRAPLWWMHKRPSFLHVKDTIRTPKTMLKKHKDRIFQEGGEFNEELATDHQYPNDSSNG